ncbi:MAG TPA: hypothetical protein VEU33_37660 [Archangium sp.]|nr:hypothetical protein [Archangium sp.]
MLEKQLVALEKAPPPGATQHVLWSEYLQYSKGRLADLRQGSASRKGGQLEPPLKWDGYQWMRETFLRGLRFERSRAQLLRDEALLPRAQRHFLQDFDSPRVETYVGVRKPESGLRFSDVLVIEQKPPAAQPPRVETFSFKSRDFSQLNEKAVEAQMKTDAGEALAYYGETLDIVRPGLKLRVQVQCVRLIYEGGALKPRDARLLKRAVTATEKKFPGVEVLFQ